MEIEEAAKLVLGISGAFEKGVRRVLSTGYYCYPNSPNNSLRII
jgi:hypothetical protein